MSYNGRRTGEGGTDMEGKAWTENDELRERMRWLRMIGKRIRRCRTQKGMAQGALAERAGIRQDFLRRIEEEGWTDTFSVQQLLRIADALGVEAYRFLMSWKEEETDAE